MKVLKNIKRFSFIFLLILILFNLSCGKKNKTYDTHDKHDEFPVELVNYCQDKKIYLTSIGQSNDIMAFDYLYSDTFDYTLDNILSPNSVEEGSVVFVFVGCSIKAISESSITIEEEKERALNFVNLKKAGKISVISFHLGGPSRRGMTSDSLIEILFKDSNMNFYVGSGNSDNYLSGISEENNIPALEVASINSLIKPLKLLLGIEE